VGKVCFLADCGSALHVSAMHIADRPNKYGGLAPGQKMFRAGSGHAKIKMGYSRNQFRMAKGN